MAELSRFVVLAGRKPVGAVVRGLSAASELREATTGRVVRLPRVMAVAAPVALPPEGAAERQPLQREVHRRAEGTARRAGLDEGLQFYRKYTEALLRRYVQMTMEAGRVSSVMGREVLGGRASSYRIHGFDDAVIFRLDVEKCLRQLRPLESEVIKRIAIQEYTHVEAADLIGVSLRTVGSRYARALDSLTAILLRVRLLEPLKGLQVRL